VNPEEIKALVAQEFVVIRRETKELEVPGLLEDALGHAAGTRMEGWVNERLKQRLREKGLQVYYPNEFLFEIFKQIGKDEKLIKAKIQENWWGSLIFTRKHISEFMQDKRVTPWQQEGADLILFYGNEIVKHSEFIILLNVKSHNIDRASRPPNIISAQRVLKFLHEIIVKKGYEDKLERLQYWILGVNWKFVDSKAIIQDVQLKDLFKLDVSKIEINFDAAIQIQWHVKDMVEKEQTRVEFITQLTNRFLTKWQKHSQGKTRRYEKLVLQINSILND
jgi:hypothetical protein